MLLLYPRPPQLFQCQCIPGRYAMWWTLILAPILTLRQTPRCASQAARYQLAFMFLAAAAATLAAASAVRLAARAVVDGDHRLRLELLTQRGDGAAGVAGFVHHEVAQVPLPCAVRSDAQLVALSLRGHMCSVKWAHSAGQVLRAAQLVRWESQPVRHCVVVWACDRTASQPLGCHRFNMAKPGRRKWLEPTRMR